MGAAKHSFDTAHAIVLRTPFPDLSIQIDYQHGVEPSKTALEALVAVARAETLKTNITVLPPRELPINLARRANEYWTLPEIKALHVASFALSRDAASLGEGNTAYLHIVYLDSYLKYDYLNRSTNAIGLESANVLFVFPTSNGVSGPRLPGAVSDAGGFTQPDEPILIHEFGHAMGLLNLGAPMSHPHQLSDDPYHSRNPESVMYAGTDALGPEERAVANWDTHGDALYDADDRADLAALRAEQP